MTGPSRKIEFHFRKEEQKKKVIILHCFPESVGETAKSLRPRAEAPKYCMHTLESLEAFGSVSAPPAGVFFFYVLMTPLLGSGLGRQGSSGSGSWANTESSPDEQVLLES